MPEPFPFDRPRLLAATDPVSAFDCGVEALNRFLQKHALQTQRGEGARTYVSLCEGLIAGYYTLAYGSVEPEAAPPRVTKGLARHPIPVMLLARLAVDRRFQGRNLGRELLRDALIRTLAAADIAGLRAMIVDAKNEPARRFYQRYGFESFPGDSLRLALLVKDARAFVSKP
jgi:ribosomal protein S18 acetylase RimI-like enzyme